jgi:hypothetical protein
MSIPLREVKCLLFGCAVFAGCTPLRDLDAAASGNGEGGGNRSSTDVHGNGGSNSNLLSGTVNGVGGTNGSDHLSSSANVEVSGVGGSLAVNATSLVTLTTRIPSTSMSVAPDLPDLPNAPVQGEIRYSAGASWVIDEVEMPAFRIETPTAAYFLLKSAAAIVSIDDKNNLPWIGYSSGYRPKRGVPNLGGCCQPGVPAKLGMPEMTTVVDSQSVTLSHLRLSSKSVLDDSYWLVWDFYVTHVTLTINRASGPFGFTYHGVPGITLDADDQLVLSSGLSRNANNAFSGDLPGPVEWAYLTNAADSTTLGSLFLIQHTDDDFPESYLVADGNSSKLVFGDGKITNTPIRFSLGLVDSVDYETVKQRVEFVISATPP